MKILYLSRWYPFPPNNGSKIRTHHILRGLAQHHDITLISFIGPQDDGEAWVEYQTLFRKIYTVPWRSYNPRSLRAVTGFFRPEPRSVIDTASPEMKAQIERVLAQEDFDVIIASQMGMAGYAHLFKGVPALLEELELGVLYERYSMASGPWQRLRHGLTWYKQRAYTARVLKYFRACTVVSQGELNLLSRSVPDYDPVVVIPNCVDLNDYAGIPSQPEPESLVFSGSFQYFPNYEAMQWFLSQVYPRVKAQVPGASLRITGDLAGKTLPDQEGVTLTGYVKDIRPVVASAWASLAPIWTGGGTRLKILESMAIGTPVISTTKGVEGIEARHNHHLLIADTPEAFAEAILRVFKNAPLREKLSKNAHQLVCQNYDWPVVMPNFLRLVDKVALRS